MPKPRSVFEIARWVGGVTVGHQDRVITGVSTPAEAEAGDLVFVDSPKHLSEQLASTAGAVIVPHGLAVPPAATAIQVAHPAAAMALAVDLLFPPSRLFEGVSPAAFVASSARLGYGVGIGPLAYVGEDVWIGDRTEVHPGATIGRGCQIGTDCVIHSGVHIYPDMIVGDRVVLHSGAVIGADGFGFVLEPARPESATAEEPQQQRKIRQVGRVVIEDDVEIGANTAVDRATLSETRIGRGTKIDNLVTIGHNASVGRHCIIIGQAGIAGSSVLGDYVTVAGQAGLAGHLHVGSYAVIGAQSGVTKDVRPGEAVLGSPAVEARVAKKALALIDSLPEFKRTLAAHARRLAELERRAGGDSAHA